MMARLLAKIKADQKEMIARLEVKIGANNEKFEVLQGALISWLDAHQAKIKANHEEWMVAMKASQERTEAPIDVSLEAMKACLEKIEANQEKVEINMEACLEEMKVDTVGALEDRYGVRRLA
jgi:DNA integrity scanning protein DisA with diadenylate cyclase activity